MSPWSVSSQTLTTSAHSKPPIRIMTLTKQLKAATTSRNKPTMFSEWWSNHAVFGWEEFFLAPSFCSGQKKRLQASVWPLGASYRKNGSIIQIIVAALHRREDMMCLISAHTKLSIEVQTAGLNEFICTISDLLCMWSHHLETRWTKTWVLNEETPLIHYYYYYYYCLWLLAARVH